MQVKRYSRSPYLSAVLVEQGAKAVAGVNK